MWPSDRRYRALSRSFGVRTNDVRAGHVVQRLLEPFSDAAPGASPTYSLLAHEEEGDGSRFTVRSGDEVVLRSRSARGAAQWIVWDACEAAAETEERALVLHAAAASWQGCGIVLPAPGGSGKTTMVGGL